VVLSVAGVDIAGGWVSLASILARFTLTTAAALVLIATTSFTGVCMALERFGMPAVLATQLLLLYRYLFVLGGEVMRVARARALRSFGNRGMEWGTYAHILGSLLVRTYERAGRIYSAMLSRGFDGTVRVPRTLRFAGRDVVFVLGWSAALIGMRLYNVPVLLGRAITGLM
jgi:cobalt/nickel transport system permease protein